VLPRWIRYPAIRLGSIIGARKVIYNFTVLIVFAATSACHTAIEYGLIAALIALAIIAAVGMTGERLITLFESLIPALTR
jgi:pilus assembly protein Flp/PilA